MEDPASNTPTTSHAAVPWLWALTLIAVVGGSAIAGYAWLQNRSALSTTNAATPNHTDASIPDTVRLGRDYYVYLKLAELRPTLADGDPWDHWSDTAPDPFYRMTWQDAQVFESPTRKDAFVAGWDLLSVDLKELLLTSGGEVDVESIINAPVIHIQQDTQIQIELIDDDTFNNTEAGTITLSLARLREGENTIHFDEEQQPLISRIVVGIVDRSISLPDLVDAVSAR